MAASPCVLPTQQGLPVATHSPIRLQPARLPAIGMRRSAAQLHALEAVVRQIRACDPNGRRKYLREFNEAFSSYEAVLRREELAALLRSAGTLLVGDYHALSASQRFAATLMSQLRFSGRPLVLALEMVFAHDQHILDEWSAGEITEGELRERIRFDVEWGYAWEPYAELLRAARAAGARICGLDCMPRGDLRRIGARDRHAATKLAELRTSHPEAQVVVLFGESHLAPNHLPLEVRTLLPQEERVLTVLQNIDALYWRACGEVRGGVEAVRVKDDVICVFNATPLEKYESYRFCIERWTRAPAERPNFTATIYNVVGALARALNIDPYSPHNGTQPKFLVDQLPEICVRPTIEALHRIMERKRVPAIDIAQAEESLSAGGMAYVAVANTVFMTHWELGGAAEPVAHFVHCACRGMLTRCSSAHAPRVVAEDRFYARVLEVALADCGARVLYPARPPKRESDLYGLYAEPRERIEELSILSYCDYMRMVDFLVFHRDYERNVRRYFEVPALITEGRNYSGERFEFVTRLLGEMLGTELYEQYVGGRINKRFIRSLLFRKLEKPGVARVAYFAAVRRLRRGKRRVN